MFKAVQKLWAHSPEKGVLFERLGKYRYLYSDGKERLLILGTNEGDIWKKKGIYIATIVFPLNARWQPPHEDEVIGEIEREEIKKNIREAHLALISNSEIEFIET